MTNVKTEQIYDVCVVGMGYVGVTLATALATAGLRVVGVDRRPEVTQAINSGESLFHEFGLNEALATVVARNSLHAQTTNDPHPKANAYIVTVGTPVRGGSVILADLEEAVRTIAGSMPDGATVILRSTVRVGTTRNIALPILKQSGRPFKLAMAPERTVEGKALAELSTLPQIVGGINAESADATAAIFGELGVEIVVVSSPEAAELAKLASNTYRDLNFAFANELAYFSDNVGIDVYEVIRASNHGYERMNVPLPGPVAGPCLEKDAYILQNSAEQYQTSVPLIMQGRKTNEALVDHFRWSLGAFSPDAVSGLAVLGLAFKGQPATSDVRGSLAGDFASTFTEFVGRQGQTVGWDPLVSEEDARYLGIEPVELESALLQPLILLQTNHRYFKSEEFQSKLRVSLAAGSVVIDLWNSIPELFAEFGPARVRVLGKSIRNG